jgi:hypothetical protein
MATFMNKENKMNKQEIRNRVDIEIDNFILYYTSDDKEREKMREVADNFIEDVYED